MAKTEGKAEEVNPMSASSYPRVAVEGYSGVFFVLKCVF